MYKERIQTLLCAIDRTHSRETRERRDAIDTVEIALELIPRCASGIYSKTITLEMAKLQVDDAVYEHMKRDLSDSRQWLCAATLKALKDMNALCDAMGVEKIYDGDMHMDALEAFCGAVIKEYFDGRDR